MKNELRIVGGEWRSRKLRFPPVQGLRPTPDRIRETLFNWLKQDLEGLSCLDLFAGSGALGFEAASRAARQVVLVDQDGEICQSLRQNCDLLAAKQIEVRQADFKSYLATQSRAFDVVFLDPPFQQNLVVDCCQRLESGGWLAVLAHIYVETERDLVLDGLPSNWVLYRQANAGQVSSRLFQRRG